MPETDPLQTQIALRTRNTSPAGLAEVLALWADLEAVGYKVVSGHQPQAGVGEFWHDFIHIVVQPEGVVVETLIVKDVYERAKAWARSCIKRRRATEGEGRSQMFTIYGPNKEVLRSWSIDEHGEHDDPPEYWPRQPRR